MNPICTFCGFYCGFAAAIGIFFFLLLLILVQTNSYYIKHLLEIHEQSASVSAMGLAMGVSLLIQS